ncbi:MAG TPA: cobalt-precorrin-6A reductase [Cyanobacteria bacterium UBA11372]|nr:cobalt-precorrin-6A reductase [Cyanobacteria bacterium UBA11372]
MDLNRCIWLIGGTTESVQLAEAIASAALPCTITVTTEAARALYPNSPLLRVWVGRLSLSDLKMFLQEHNIVAVVDASHPYAVEVSRCAIAACSQFNIPYLRYERPCLERETRGDGKTPRRPDAPTRGEELLDPQLPITNYQLPITNYQLPITIHLNSCETLVTGNYLAKQRVLLTVGYKYLPLFRPWQEKATLFARILPSLVSIDAALAAGFTPDRIIALRPPISADLETALWRQWEISMVVTKASGAPGGEDVKRKVAAELGVTLIVIDRPLMEYPQQTSELATAIAFCQKYL